MSDRLREAAQRLVDIIFAEAQAEPFILPLRTMRAANDLRSALAAPPSGGSLNVERLARADWEVFGGARASGSTWDDLDDRTKAATLSYAEKVAAEYARLTEDAG